MENMLFSQGEFQMPSDVESNVFENLVPIQIPLDVESNLQVLHAHVAIMRGPQYLYVSPLS
jgi:hypothetical protein